MSLVSSSRPRSLCIARDHFTYLAKRLITTHDPNIPHPGSRMKTATAAIASMWPSSTKLMSKEPDTDECCQATALSYVRTLCGVAVSNSHVPAEFTASLAIIIFKCGHRGHWPLTLRMQAAASSRVGGSRSISSISCAALSKSADGLDSEPKGSWWTIRVGVMSLWSRVYSNSILNTAHQRPWI